MMKTSLISEQHTYFKHTNITGDFMDCTSQKFKYMSTKTLSYFRYRILNGK